MLYIYCTFTVHILSMHYCTCTVHVLYMYCTWLQVAEPEALTVIAHTQTDRANSLCLAGEILTLDIRTHGRVLRWSGSSRRASALPFCFSCLHSPARSIPAMHAARSVALGRLGTATVTLPPKLAVDVVEKANGLAVVPDAKYLGLC